MWSPLSNDHLSAISAMNLTGQLFLRVQDRAINSDHVVVFLRHLLRHIEGKILVLWDGSPIHRAKKTQAFLANGVAARIHLERLAGCAPELHPDKGISRYLKRVELRTLACRDLSHLRIELRKAIQRLRCKPNVIASCIRQPGYIGGQEYITTDRPTQGQFCRFCGSHRGESPWAKRLNCGGNWRNCSAPLPA